MTGVILNYCFEKSNKSLQNHQEASAYYWDCCHLFAASTHMNEHMHKNSGRLKQAVGGGS